MKKIILLALAVLIMVGCGEYEGKNQKSVALMGYSDVEIDSCQYVTGYNVLAHKGNCCFCEERDSIKWEKRKKELIEQLKKK